MKYANKFSVVPYKCPPDITLSPQKTLITDKKIDKDLTNIITNKSITPDQKVKLYNQTLLKNANLLPIMNNQLPSTVTNSKVDETKPTPIHQESSNSIDQSVKNEDEYDEVDEGADESDLSMLKTFLQQTIKEEINKQFKPKTPIKPKKRQLNLTIYNKSKKPNLNESIVKSMKTQKELAKLGNRTPEIQKIITDPNLNKVTLRSHQHIQQQQQLQEKIHQHRQLHHPQETYDGEEDMDVTESHLNNTLIGKKLAEQKGKNKFNWIVYK